MVIDGTSVRAARNAEVVYRSDTNPVGSQRCGGNASMFKRILESAGIRTGVSFALIGMLALIAVSTTLPV